MKRYDLYVAGRFIGCITARNIREAKRIAREAGYRRGRIVPTCAAVPPACPP